jgi:LacI family transcriptional regulator
MAGEASASIKDVAARAGVSPGTVSNVYSGKRPVKQDLVLRVKAAAAELGYQPDRAASQLRSGKARVIAILVPSLNNPFFTALVASVEKRVVGEGYEIIVASSNGDAATEEARLAALLAWRPAGLVMIPCNDAFPTRELIEQAGVPYVVADRVADDLHADAVTIDNVAAGELAARHLIAMGHVHVVIAATTLRLANIRERSAGIIQAYRGNGLPPPSVIEIGSEYDDVDIEFDIARNQVHRVIEREGRPSAFLGLTNFATLGVLATLSQLDLKVPSDVSLLGFDDYSWMHAVTPALSAMRQPVDEMGQVSWTRLRTRIEGDDSPPVRVRLPCELMKRSSVMAVQPTRKTAELYAGP